MSKSLAVVGILSIIGLVGTWSAVGQDNTTQSGTSVTVKNHINDAERDQLMQKAMEDARLELEKQKAGKQAQEDQKAEIKKRAADAELLAAEARKQAEQDRAEQQNRESAIAAQAAANNKAAAETKVAADRKAEEARLAARVAEDEKNSSSKATAQAQAEAKSDITDLDKVKPNNSEKTTVEPVKKATVATTSKDKKSAGNTKSYYTDSAEKTESSEKNTAHEKVVIETVSTKKPGSALSMKSTMPTGDEERKAEQAAARNRTSQPESQGSRVSDSDRKSMSGQVIGMMRSTDGKPRLLLSTEDSQMVQVIMEDAEEDVPAPGALVSVSGREVGGGNGRPVISARSITIKSGQGMNEPPAPRVQPQEISAPVISEQVMESQFAMPGVPMMMAPPMGLGMMYPPMPMMQGPGMMMGHPYPF